MTTYYNHILLTDCLLLTDLPQSFRHVFMRNIFFSERKIDWCTGFTTVRSKVGHHGSLHGAQYSCNYTRSCSALERGPDLTPLTPFCPSLPLLPQSARSKELRSQVPLDISPLSVQYAYSALHLPCNQMKWS